MKETTVEVVRHSQITGVENIMTLDMSPEEYEVRWTRWKNGEYIQDAFNNLSAGEREFIMTGITPEEWDDMFGGMDDEEDED
jgi:hypothetical protein